MLAVRGVNKLGSEEDGRKTLHLPDEEQVWDNKAFVRQDAQNDLQQSVFTIESCARGLLALRHSMGFLVEGWFSVALAVDSRNGGGWPTFLRLRLFFAGLDCLLLFLKISHQLGSFLRQCRHF